jgi:FMN-dependent NADH-azoreductase
MSHLLQIKASLFDSEKGQGVSSQLSGELIAKLAQLGIGSQVTLADFSVQPVPHLDAQRLQALMTPADRRTAAQADMVEYADGLISQLQDADELVIGVPMYNFAIPSMLSSWIDHIARAGVTFKYTDQGAVGLLTNKKVYLVVAMGGKHNEGETDHMRPYLRTVMGFLGLSDIEVIVADGLNMGEEARNLALANARTQIDQVVSLRKMQLHAA